MGEEDERKGEMTTKTKNFINNCKSILMKEPFGDIGLL
jgi:hypothetical protein